MSATGREVGMRLKEYFLNQAERCELLAAECTTPAIRAGLLRLAIEYTNRADDLDDRPINREDA